MTALATDSLAHTIERFKETVEKRESAKIYQLPIWRDEVRGIPNEFIRSALFAAIQAQGRDYLDNVEIACQDGFTIIYTGQRLDQSHLDVFEGVMHIARGTHEGNRVCFSAHKLLRLIGRSTGKSDHVWLLRTLQHLTATAVVIKDVRAKRLFWGSLLPKGAAEEDSAQYVVEVNRDLAKLFERGYTNVDSEQRRQLRRKPLAQWLHLYYSSHAKPHPVSVSWLCDKSGSKANTLRSFRQKLKAALDELVTVGALESWTIIDDLVHVVRHPTPSQQRFINRQG